MTDWVLNAALRQIHAWQEAGLTIPLAVNLTVRDLQDPSLPERIDRLVTTWGIAPEGIQFELTESALMDDTAGSLGRITRLKETGSKIYIDDFGTGYSCLSYLRRLPVDAIKIDQSFIVEMLGSQSTDAIVRSMIDLAHHLRLEVIAEGVEDRAVWEHLCMLSCDMAQGYLLSPPMPADKFVAWQTSGEWKTNALRVPITPL